MASAGYRLLLVDVYWLDEDGQLYGPGYVLVDNGRVAALEPGEPGEEEQYAEMIAGGPGRLVVPGFAGIALPELYVIRTALKAEDAVSALLGGHPASKLVEDFGLLESYYATLLTAWEASLNAVTRLVVVSRHPAAAAQALSDSGLTGLVLAPDETCRGTPLGHSPLGDAVEEARRRGADLARVKIANVSCSQVDNGWTIEERGLATPGRGIHRGLGWFPLTTPWLLLYASRGASWRVLTAEIHRGVEADYEVYSGLAHLAVLETSQPPSWCPPSSASPACLGPAAPRVETVISGGRVVVDGGVSLYTGGAAAAEAEKRLRDLAARARRLA